VRQKGVELNRQIHCWRVIVMTVLIATLLAACGNDEDQEPAASASTATHIVPAAAPDNSPVATPPPVPDATPPPSPASETPVSLSPRERAAVQPNELGVIPILEYHLFTTDPAAEDHFTRTIEDFHADLQWLYDHEFYVIPMADLVRDNISAPAGKHPVVLTFDDASPSQFRLIEQPDGNLLVDPDSAVGVMEAFFATHPDFGRGGFFALLNFNCFASSSEPGQMQYCERKLRWLAENGYEIGNHTIDHQDLLDVSDKEFKRQLCELWDWIEQNVPASGQLPSVIAMPYGNYPDKDMHQAQRAMLRDGYWYEGEEYGVEGALMVGAEPAPSPSSATWDKVWIPRIQAFDDELGRWFPAFADGGVILYTSDGRPGVITVPDPLPGWLDGTLDPDLIAASGKTLTQYDSDTGQTTDGTTGAPAGWHRRETIFTG